MPNQYLSGNNLILHIYIIIRKYYCAYFVLIQAFYILWFGEMLRIHQFYAILKFVKAMDFEELSQSLRDDFRLSLFILNLYYYFFSWYITSNPFKPIILAIISQTLYQVFQEWVQSNYLIVIK